MQMSLVTVDLALGTSRWPLLVAGLAEARLHRSEPKRGPKCAEPETPHGPEAALHPGPRSSEPGVSNRLAHVVLETQKPCLMSGLLQ